jgi:hypothetical protein
MISINPHKADEQYRIQQMYMFRASKKSLPVRCYSVAPEDCASPRQAGEMFLMRELMRCITMPIMMKYQKLWSSRK